MLNARLAAAESMTHDVIRDLLGVKLDMTNYAVKLQILNPWIFFIVNVNRNKFSHGDNLVQTKHYMIIWYKLNP